ncbi:MAG: magnesium/cobalt transporter CorA [Pseudomonadota bacterium]
MIRIFQLSEYFQQKVNSLKEATNLENVVWIDLQNPTEEQIKEVEEKYNIKFPTLQQQEEIESSSRYLEDFNAVKINSTFLNIKDGKLDDNEVSFIITKKILFSLRNFDSQVISETVKKIKNQPTYFDTPAKIFIAISETRIDLDADLIELVSKYIVDIGKKISYKKNVDEEIILKISECQELTMSLRETLFDKQRVITLFQRNSDLMEENEQRLRIIFKDIHSLIEYANFNFTRLEYLQNNFLALINIEQNKVIKIFTVASLIFMPPTLIASIYGMNFNFMPELKWLIGYPFAIGLMLFSSVITVLIFKKKGWL